MDQAKIDAALAWPEGRPIEPNVANESPEEWAEIAEWETSRANTLAEAYREQLS